MKVEDLKGDWKEPRIQVETGKGGIEKESRKFCGKFNSFFLLFLSKSTKSSSFSGVVLKMISSNGRRDIDIRIWLLGCRGMICLSVVRKYKLTSTRIGSC